MRLHTVGFVSSFLFYMSFLSAQSPPEINGHYVTVPPSPTAFEFTKYGNIPVNEYKGMISPSIPLYVYKAGHLTLPISMSYSGRGVKLAQLSSWTGINWNLNAGGVITRTVKDRPDELSSTNRMFYSSASELLQLDPGLLHQIANPGYNYDTQLDEFNFRFLNYSGSFYLDENSDFKLATYDTKLKIESFGTFSGNESDGIVITTPDGIKYYFGGVGFVEQSEMLSNGAGSSTSNIWNTSYYLAYIEHPKGDKIYFEYGTESPYNTRWSSSERMTCVPEGSVTSIYIDAGYSGPTQQLAYNRTYHGRYLDKITSNRTDLIVDLFSSPQTTSTYDYNRILNKIEIHNPYSNSTDKHIVDFTYYKPQTNIMTRCRFFLKKIDQSRTGEHKFEYYNIDYTNNTDELPDRFSYAQDFFGYYNGQDSNETLLPANSSQYFQQGANGVTFANRSPSFGHAVTGSLKKITYPTGGHTIFEYEPNPKRVQLPPKNVRLEVYNNWQAFYPPGAPNKPDKLSSNGNIGTCLIPIPGSQGPQPQPLSSSQRIYFDLQYTVLSGSLTQWHDFEVTIRDVTSSPASIFDQRTFNLQGHPAPDPGDPSSYTHHLYFDIDFEKDHCYSVELKLIVPSTPQGVQNEPVLANLSFSYGQGYGCQPNGIGLRIKRVTDFAKSGKPENIKRYYYKSAKQYVKNDVNCPYSANYTSAYLGSAVIARCPPPIGFGVASGPLGVAFIKADTHNSTVRLASDGFSYGCVTISLGGDNFEKGGVEKKFNYRPKNTIINALGGGGETASYANSINSNRHVFGGRLLSKKYLIKDIAEGLKIEKIEEYSYSDYWDDFEWNVYLDKYYCGCNIAANSPIYFMPSNDPHAQEGFFAGFYRSFQNRFDLDTIVETEYIEPLPVLSQNDDTGYEKIVKETYFEYNQYVGLPTKTTKTTSEPNKFLITKNYYPGIVPPPQPTIGEIDKWNNLLLQHRLTPPIETKTYVEKNGLMNLLSTKRTLYGSFHGITLPSSLEISKGSDNLEKRVEFIDYNTIGRLNKLSINGGSEISYTYDADGKVTSKTKNAGGSAHVILYEYDDMDRLIKVTDPRGYVMNYSYDAAGRLKNIKDNDGNLLKSYEYHYDK